jgi:hypothetical protein
VLGGDVLSIGGIRKVDELADRLEVVVGKLLD